MFAFTPGEPAGIGPDLAVMIAQQPESAQLVAFTDPELLEQRAELLKLPLHIVEAQSTLPFNPGTLRVEPIKLVTKATAGVLNPLNSPFVLNTISAAVKATQKGLYRALITGPIHKGVINQAGTPFSGHTEFLAELTHTRRVVMMLTTKYGEQQKDELRVALATTHLPLKDVPGMITKKLLIEVIEILHHSLQKQFGISHPSITVCGLNPHAGEGGHLGDEEIRIIQPVIEQLKKKGMKLLGPIPADTAFTQNQLNRSDAVLAMYHDQGLPVLKHLGFGRAVNLTLGLPIIRSSVDHGTALDLAGTGLCDKSSLLQAIKSAKQLSQNSH
ncbi:MAG: 4-hydroxythreonine-4-phosphate dehydrogenase PdxA [Gammaproteobacteria bacterium]|nr:4-hydroxythreonine-4-phosphate dehydrogenase PdxA [Gammaproteobacteria bacterium]